MDGQWYRAKVERVSGPNVSVRYVDYGNREVTQSTKCASLPAGFSSQPHYAHEMRLALVKFSKDVSAMGCGCVCVCVCRCPTQRIECILNSLASLFLPSLSTHSTFPQEDYVEDALAGLMAEVEGQDVVANREYRANGVDYVSLQRVDNKTDVAETMLSQGLVLMDERKDKRFASLVRERESGGGDRLKMRIRNVR